ncbi:hypothetical protein SLS53_000261 [Cytospora paraplurivora]|uniref:Methyltransferase type 12 domain-containing protein n=1 Tax=Cytospora paraplurivora TaxID=2898453 RepID=A0AAN9UMU4_9PEZI
MATTATASTVSSDSDVHKKEVIYKSWDLLIYEIWVLGIVSTWAWGCGTNQYLLPQFRANHHLDIGSGTGYYLRKGNIPQSTNLSLVDLERSALEVGLRRSGRADGNNVRGIVADILQPLPVDDRFDSVSMYYLLHCFPAPVDVKCRIIQHIKRNMTPNGVIHGAN